MLTIYTDGACSGNPGPGAWAAIINSPSGEESISGYEPETTNNRMELLAVISALSKVSKHLPTTAIEIYTDSQYVQKGMTEWLTKWQQNNWRTAAKQPVKNYDLWQQLVELSQALRQQNIQLKWQWVKGHATDECNQRADGLARATLAAAQSAVTAPA